jgi:hypothetical protein
MSDAHLLAFGCGISFIVVAAVYVAVRERLFAGRPPARIPVRSTPPSRPRERLSGPPSSLRRTG